MLPGHAYLDVQFKGTCSNCDNKFEILRSIEYFEKDIPINQYFTLYIPLETSDVSKMTFCQRHAIIHLELHLF